MCELAIPKDIEDCLALEVAWIIMPRSTFWRCRSYQGTLLKPVPLEHCTAHLPQSVALGKLVVWEVVGMIALPGTKVLGQEEAAGMTRLPGM
ncbi:hypothetical protein GJ744_005478 [Endocarpon pusillum]|uniref:Uncharacterized protein n=1 Tax=Endocarpon pusillum TaxID=364733 RepID=A0A8H7DYD8_9EURO|nr:hypothetical protein GJ744_005478 [Endocarpon pusillum]